MHIFFERYPTVPKGLQILSTEFFPFYIMKCFSSSPFDCFDVHNNWGEQQAGLLIVNIAKYIVSCSSGCVETIGKNCQFQICLAANAATELDIDNNYGHKLGQSWHMILSLTVIKASWQVQHNINNNNNNGGKFLQQQKQKPNCMHKVCWQLITFTLRCSESEIACVRKRPREREKGRYCGYD